ncbi:protein sickie isoform X2 [Ceratina calcarata]|uniref:Protein sickie isoform X2 n=1 Tax=Ceratina calcarata TaxID=156304 RepID=A0AAJ7IRS9_9HYME|nr:protein sickie isoform X2 [Ceratina calcarata]
MTRDDCWHSVENVRMSGAAGFKPSAVLPRNDNGAKPKSKISKLSSPKSLIPPLAASSPKKSQEPNARSLSSSPAKSHSSVSSTSPRRTSLSVDSMKKSRKYSQYEDRQQALHQNCARTSPKRSPRRYITSYEEDYSQDEMGLSLRIPSTGGGGESEMSFLEFESLYTLEKELMQSRQDVGQTDDKCIFGGWLGRRGVYTELPDPFYQQPVVPTAAASQIPMEGFSFAPGWSLNVEHFYQWQHRGKSTQQIYTDWANYYLERGGCKRRVTDLQTDLCDGVLLADLVEAVTNQKVIDVNRKPKNAQQMVENVSLCVGALRALGADVGSVNPSELAAGSTLWPVLALLFALSRYKQRAKQLQDMPRLPSPYNKQSAVGGAGGCPGVGTSIPLPATVAATRRCPPDKIRPAPTPTHQSQLGGLKQGNGIGSASSSRSTSPSQQQSAQSGLSFIPQPRNQSSTNRQPAATTPSPRTSTVGKPSSVRSAQPSPYTAPGAPAQQNKNSVLDKFKLFNNKEKNQDRGKASSGVSKRTSSSSGFSSARSEHSDSSTSLCDQSKQLQLESPKSRALKSKLQSTKAAKQASPKTVRKEQSKAQSKIARTKGVPDKLGSYNPPLEDVKASKIGGVGTKLAMDKKSSNFHDLLKQQPSSQLQKLNPSMLVPAKQITPQDTKNFGSLKNDTSKQSSRPKMELPAKIPDAKIHLQNMKAPPNGLNKDVLVQKGLMNNANGMIKQPEEMMTDENSLSIDHTLTMNQANLCDQKMDKHKQISETVLRNNQSESMENANSPSKQRDASLSAKARVSNEVQDSERAHERQIPNSPRNNPESTTDEKLADVHEGPTTHPVTNHSVPSQVSNLNFGANKQPPILNSPLQGSGLNGSGSPGSSIPKPTALVKGTSKPPKENGMPGAPTPTKLKADALHRKLDPNTVAMVSPMPSISDLMSESSHSNSNSTGQSNSSDSSVIYRPSSESGSEIKTIPNRKIDTTFEQMEKVLSESSTCGGSMGDDEAEMTVKPMQPLLRGYTPGARALQTLPSRTTARQYTILHSSSHHHVGHDYADIDVTSGYLSDGEVLRGGMTVGSRTLSDLCDGYMSEGGASLYARRINPSYGHDHERYVGGSRRELSGVKELVTSRRVQKRPSANVVRSDGGCIGGSPGSGLLGGCSGGSDALAELTIEDLASIPAGNHTTANHTGHSSHHKRVPGGGGVIVGGGGNSATPQGAQQSSNLVYRVVSSRHPGHHPHVKKSDSSQQTENSAFKHQQQSGSNSSANSSSNSQQWKKYIEAGAARDRERDKEGAPPSPSPSRRSQDKHRKQAMAEYANGEKPQKVSSGTSTSGSSKVRGVPQSFGYVKRHSAGTSPSPNGVQNGKDSARTAQVSAVPRTKVKVSGGTQTCTTELQANSSSSNQGHHYKSYSLTGPSASQLSQSVRDRLMLGSQSLPKPGSPEFTALFASAHHRERGSGAGPTTASFSPRVLKPSDGSLSDTCSNYAAPDLQGYYTPNSPYTTSWMRHSNTYTPSGRSQGMGLCEADSVESLGSHRASLTHARLLIHQRDSTGSPAPPRLNRSNSIRSTKSEKMYPSMLARGSGASSSVGEEVGVGVGMGVGVEPYYSVPVGSTGCTGQHWSQPTSPTPTHASRQPPNLYQHVHKDDDIHGSSVSLVSTASSLYSSAEEKQAHELRKLRRELVDAQEKVHSLTSQLSTNAHVVSAFEQSLSNMTQRLQQLTATAEKKDSELQELRETIERLRKQSAEAGLNNGPANNGRRHTLGDSDSGTTGCTGNSSHQGPSMARQLSADSVTSLNSLSSACSASSHHKKKGWLRSSFSKAFSRSRKNRHGSVSDAEDCKETTGGDLSAPNSPRLPNASKHDSPRGQGARSNGQKSPEVENPLTGSKSSSALYKKEDEDVVELKKQLREKDLVLTDIRLEALSSAHQLESLKDTVIKMRNEMLNLKQNNERLQRLVTSKSLTSSQSSLPSDPDRRFSMTEVASTVAALANGDASTTADQLEDLNVPEHSVVSSTTTTTGEPAMEQDTDGKRINVAIYLGNEKNFNYNLVNGSTSDGSIGEPPHCVIASVCISNKTTWDSLDSTVRRCFKEYVSRVDPVTNLGLGVECVAAYHLGESSRCITDSQHPELLPCGYLIGHVKTIYLVLSGYSWLAVDTLIPRSIVQRLISLLTEHRRVILCGPSGTGKSYLAGKLAHALVDADNDTKDATAVATFNVDHKSSKELRQYLAHIAERCDSNAADELPRVIILENLQHAASLGELFSGLLGTKHSSCPAIIGTMSQATCSTTNLQLHHNFRWVLCANHMEPVKGFLGRYLRRKLLEHELRESGGTRNAEMAAVVEWLPRVWLHLNKFLETHSSSDVTIGPRLFLSCPMEVTGSQVWFTDLWNYSVVPYLVEAVREGLTLYGRRVSGNGNGDSPWEDPTQFITSSYPWISTHAVHGGSDALLRLRPEDVGYDVVTSGHASGVGASSVKSLGSTHSDNEGDPLLNMLMRLQEAANYSSPHSNDSDSITSLDSSHTRHSEDLSSSTSSSRGVESAL